MKKVKHLLLEKALPFYENFRAQRTDAAVEREQADTWDRLGFIAAEFGQLPRVVPTTEVRTRLAGLEPFTMAA